MKYTELGHTGIRVSQLCVGCMSFGEVQSEGHQWLLDQAGTEAVVAQALDLGINFFDTANTYAGGTSEIYLGNALRSLGIPREDVIIADKVYFNPGHLSKEAILREADQSLERLGTDYIDLYQIHRFDYGTPIEETLEALDSLVKAGKVRAIGASAMFGYQFHNMMITAEKHGWTQFSTMQNHHNLIYREDERELIPVCDQYGVSRIPYSPLAGGHLARPDWNSESLRSRTDVTLRAKYDLAMENDLEIIARVHDIAENLSVSMSAVALAWLYTKGVAAPIIGSTKAHHLTDAVKALDIVFTDAELKYLEEPYRAHEIVGAR